MNCSRNRDAVSVQKSDASTRWGESDGVKWKREWDPDDATAARLLLTRWALGLYSDLRLCFIVVLAWDGNDGIGSRAEESNAGNRIYGSENVATCRGGRLEESVNVEDKRVGVADACTNDPITGERYWERRGHQPTTSKHLFLSIVRMRRLTPFHLRCRVLCANFG